MSKVKKVDSLSLEEIQKMLLESTGRIYSLEYLLKLIQELEKDGLVVKDESK